MRQIRKTMPGRCPRQISCSVLFAIPLAAALALTASASPLAGDDAWLSKIRRDHPRMFFNADTWPAIKAHTLSDPVARAAADGEERIWQIQHLF